MYDLIIMSANPECNKYRGPFSTLEEARKKAKSWDGKVDRYLFDYEIVEIRDRTTRKIVETIRF